MKSHLLISKKRGNLSGEKSCPGCHLPPRHAGGTKDGVRAIQHVAGLAADGDRTGRASGFGLQRLAWGQPWHSTGIAVHRRESHRRSGDHDSQYARGARKGVFAETRRQVP